jgi:hypothetical protein
MIDAVQARRSTTRARKTALLALSALLLVPVVAASGLAVESEAAGEPCVGCSGCDDGECGDDEPGTHHHCCLSCCMAHTTMALPAAPASALPFDVAPMASATRATVIVRAPDAPFRPPRA